MNAETHPVALFYEASLVQLNEISRSRGASESNLDNANHEVKHITGWELIYEYIVMNQ